MRQLGLALIGCGGMGRNISRQLVTLESARLVGVTDADPAATTRLAEEFGTTPFDSAEALLDRPDVDAVIIALPGYLHRQYTEAAAARGKHLFVEKPMATNTADCDAMIAAAEAAGVTLMVGQVLRYYPCWWQLNEIIRSGEIGKPLGLQITRVHGGWGEWNQDWRKSRELSGGILMELNSHEIDFMCQVGGEVEEIYALAESALDHSSDFPNLFYVSMRFANGMVGLLHASTMAALNSFSGLIQGTEGTLIYSDGFGPEGLIQSARRDGTARVVRVPDVKLEHPIRRELRLFVEALLNGEPVPVSAWEGRRNVAVAEAAYESARTGKPVRPR